MSIATLTHRLLAPPPRNLATGDLVARVFTVAALLVLAGIIAPQTGLPYPLIKISLLIAAELGLVSLMLGLFLRSHTYFAGLQLLVASLTMLWFTNRNVPWLAIAVALLFVTVGITNVVTRRSRLNALLELNAPRLLDPVPTEDPRKSSGGPTA